MITHHLAELNIAEAIYPMDDPRIYGFTSRINTVNALADRASGFIWRLVDDNPDSDGALSLRPFDNPNMLVNMSVWQDIPSLFDFVYKTVHAKVMSGKPAWFSHLKSHNTVMWWVKAGHIPNLEEAKAKLEYVNKNGSSPEAFTFKHCYSTDGKPLIWNQPKKDCA